MNMSVIFIDEDQRLFKQPVEIWETIFNSCSEPDPHKSSSLRAVTKVFAAVSKAFNKLVKKIPLKPPHPYAKNGLSLFLCHFGYATLLEYALKNGLRVVTESTSIVALKGHLDCLKLLIDFGCKLYPALIDEAAQGGHLHIVQHLIQKRVRPVDTTMKLAIASGRVDLVQYLEDYVEIQIYTDISLDAAKSGSLEMVKFIEQFVPLEQRAIVGSAQSGSIDILKYYMDAGIAPNDPSICLRAMTRGAVRYTKFAIDHGAPLSEELMQSVTKTNDVEFMKELRARGCPWDGAAIKQAANDGCFEALRYLIDNGCPFAEASAQSKWFRYGVYGPSFSNEATTLAAYSARIDCLKYLMEHGAPWPSDIIDRMHAFGKVVLPVIKYLHEHGCPWSANSSKSAVHCGLAVLKYAHENKCPWNETTCEQAAKVSDTACLEYALNNNCPVDDTAMRAALLYGPLEAVKLLHKRGIPIPSDVCGSLLSRANLDILKYAHENGAQWATDTVAKGLNGPFANRRDNDTLSCLKYAIENGCPWDPKEALTLARRHYFPDVIEWVQSFIANSQ